MAENIRNDREIPYNYTSADDQRVIRILFGPEAWTALERLRSQRVTGRSARLLLRLIGDLFILMRNPFLLQEMTDAPGRRRDFFASVREDLEIIERSANRNPDVFLLVGFCREALEKVELSVKKTRWWRRMTKLLLAPSVGTHNVVFDPVTLVGHATDATDWRLYLPVAVVFPEKEEQVGPLLRSIGGLGLHAVPRGAGTGLTGGAIPTAPDCVMVNTEKLDRIRGIREEAVPPCDGEPAVPVPVIEVEAGVVTENAMAAAESQGLVFATDPTSAWACTIGGNISENAGGKTAVLWGTAIDNLLSYRLATPQGDLITVRRTSHPRHKILPEDTVRFEVSDGKGRVLRVVELLGSDIRRNRLWKDITNKTLKGLPGLQKEGTDGVITSAVFILYPEYECKATFCLEFFGPDMDEASRVILDLSRAFVNRGEEAVMALEHFDDEYVQAIDYKVKAGRSGRPKAVILMDLVAHAPEQLERGRQRLEKVLTPHTNTVLITARDTREAGLFWQDRKRLGAIARRTNAFKLNEDIVLPLERLAEFADHIEETNVAEERYNHAEVVRSLRDILRSLAGDEWIASRLPDMDTLCTGVLDQAQTASKRQLRENQLLNGLMDGLRELFAGQKTVTEELARRFRETRARLIVIATHMHAGDGNVHVNIPVFSNDRGMMLRAATTADAVMRQAVALGGVVSGEHGIGVTKLQHLEPELLGALAEYRLKADPQGLMNPGKLSDPTVPDKVFTPSFNLLELEARIIQHGSLGVLADKISRCVRCGKCKPDCCVFVPSRGMFFHPRNKNLAIGSLIEALLYDAQRSRSTKFELLKHLEEIADHCTICHKCLKPCPVDIDTGEVSIMEREILKARRYKHTALATRLSLAFLMSRSNLFNWSFRTTVLRLGTFFQRQAANAVRRIPDLMAWKRQWPFSLIYSPIRRPSAGTLRSVIPHCEPDQALVIHPPRTAEKTVFYFPGCGSERLFSDISLASLYLLLKSNVRVILPPPFLCCGFPFTANARTEQSGQRVLNDTIIFTQIREMMRHLNFDAVAVSCGTCLEALRSMGTEDIFGSPLQDVSSFVLANGLSLPTGTDPVLYHKPCHDSLEDQGVQILKQAGLIAASVPHCCSEAGTLALSRPDIACNMLDCKAAAIRSALAGRNSNTLMLTNCPSCVQGLGRNERLGFTTRHLAVELACRAGGPGWEKELRSMLGNVEAINF